jgi:hypothetical protein
VRFLQIIAIAWLMLLCAGAPDPVRAQTPVCDGTDSTPYTLRIRDFDGAELNKLVDAFTAFACYQHHHLVKSMPGLTEYVYDARADSDRLRRQLVVALEQMNIRGSISVTTSNIVIVEKTLPRPH